MLHIEYKQVWGRRNRGQNFDRISLFILFLFSGRNEGGNIMKKLSKIQLNFFKPMEDRVKFILMLTLPQLQTRQQI